MQLPHNELESCQGMELFIIHSFYGECAIEYTYCTKNVWEWSIGHTCNFESNNHFDEIQLLCP